MLEQVSNMVRLGANADPDAAHRRAADRRIAVEEELRLRIGKGIAGPLRLFFFMKILRATQRYWMHRDNQRHTFDRYFYELRRAYRALGARFVDGGMLDRPDDIFFLGKKEIYAFLDGALSSRQLKRRADLRQTWWNEVTKAEPAPSIRGNQPHDLGAPLPDDCDIAGTGGAPGKATGPVRLVRNMQELRDVQPGEIVVTQAIDPAWTPVFGIIGGVISEEGGMLSHATVLGREYGLPVVIGARGATQMLETGELVAVNGTSGTIHRVVDTPSLEEHADP